MDILEQLRSIADSTRIHINHLLGVNTPQSVILTRVIGRSFCVSNLFMAFNTPNPSTTQPNATLELSRQGRGRNVM